MPGQSQVEAAQQVKLGAVRRKPGKGESLEVLVDSGQALPVFPFATQQMIGGRALCTGVVILAADLSLHWLTCCVKHLEGCRRAHAVRQLQRQAGQVGPPGVAGCPAGQPAGSAPGPSFHHNTAAGG